MYMRDWMGVGICLCEDMCASVCEHMFVWVCEVMCARVCVSTCVYECVRTRVYECMRGHVCMCVWGNVCMRTCVHVCVRTCVSRHMYMYVCKDTCACLWGHVCMCVWGHICLCVWEHVCVRIHMHVYGDMCECVHMRPEANLTCLLWLLSALGIEEVSCWTGSLTITAGVADQFIPGSGLPAIQWQPAALAWLLCDLEEQLQWSLYWSKLHIIV